MKTKFILAALAAIAVAAPASADVFNYNLSDGGKMSIDNTAGTFEFVDPSGARSSGSGVAFKRWTKDANLNDPVRTTYMFDSWTGTYNGRDLSGGKLWSSFTNSNNELSLWHPVGDIHFTPNFSGSTGGSSGGSSSGGASSSGASSSGASSSGASSSGGSSGGSGGGSPVPAPGVIGLFGAGLIGLGLARHRRRKSKGK